MIQHDNNKTRLQIIVAIPDDLNINTKKTEKLSKYKYLEIAVSRMWNVGTKIVRVITGALGTIKKDLDQNLGRSQSTWDMLSNALDVGVSVGALPLGNMEGRFFPRAFERRKNFFIQGNCL
jgi:hypothetical protein